MKNHLNQILFLGVAFLIAVSGLTMALTEEAIAGPICPNCTCTPAPCGIGDDISCVSTGVICDGSPGTPSTCAEYCAWTLPE